MKNKKRIMIYYDSMNASGGIERVIANLITVWVKEYDICLVVKDEGVSFYPLPDAIEIKSLHTAVHLNMHNRVQRFFSLIKSLMASRKKLSKVVREVKPDYIYAAHIYNLVELFLIDRSIRSKIVMSEHGSYYGYNKIYTLLKRCLYPRVYCVSVPNRMDVEVYNGWKNNAIFIPHLVTYSVLKRNPLNTKVVLNIGRLTQDKRQDVLIKIWSEVKNKQDWQLWIVGDGEEKEKLQMLIVELNLEQSVKLLPARKNIEEIYQQASVFAFSSQYEGFGMVLLEAMSFGIPCISFDCPSGPRDVIKNNVNGYLIENANTEQYVILLEKLIHMDLEELQQYGRAAYDFVQQWDNGKIEEEWKRVFR